MAAARHYETAQKTPAPRLADTIVNACAIIASVKEDIMDRARVSHHVSALVSFDRLGELGQISSIRLCIQSFS
ncbi:uncharacterized protein BDW47DRAFT_102080 [Aspergillus candidus]|uniref:Uncharacterized protein n=1 Tax=Aspergillus candidus TaxID=41067 RepID=A0A2I2FHA0_ASPCN|nr:hypothetical protein BDW47DRAFT_102080 [Aspergillus candidus]PLB40003.1 hypothetical protein BDW47DRAFT_102080 [Aspergillus candidus]